MGIFLTDTKIPPILKKLCKDKETEEIVKAAIIYGECVGIAGCTKSLDDMKKKKNDNAKAYKIQQLKGNEV